VTRRLPNSAYHCGNAMAWWWNTGKVNVNVDSVRLDPGAHRSPRDGVCLMELASLMAEERFSDRPRCVCVVIAAFLRDWNDRSGYAERQRLRPYARSVLGSRAARSTTHRRRDVCLIWAGADLSGNWVSRAIRRLAMRLRIMAILGIRPALRLNEGAGQLAARVVFSRYDSESGLMLVDDLLQIGSEEEPDGAAEGDGRDGRALRRAIVESAVRHPVPLPMPGGDGDENGRVNGGAGSAEAPERVPADV
jgi:hypothetical protein